MAATNRAVTFLGPYKLEVQDRGYPKLADPKGKKIEHAVILKLITTNTCGSDLHIYHGRFAAPSGMQLGHENTGEVVEVGSHVERIKVGNIVSSPCPSTLPVGRAGAARNAIPTSVSMPMMSSDIAERTASISADGRVVRRNT